MGLEKQLPSAGTRRSPALAGLLLLLAAGCGRSSGLQSGNPCLERNGGCDPNATCTNDSGTASCACNAGYTGNGTSCSATDPCATDNGGCDSHATCASTGAGTRSCACLSGFSGDGINCTPSMYQVTASGTNAVVSPASPVTVTAGSTPAFTVTASPNDTLSTAVGGTCPAGSWSGDVYTTGAIVGDCSVSFSATPNTYRITASGDSWETFSPADPQTVSDGATQAYTVAANAGYTLSTSVGGTCPVGSWSGDVYTTGAIVSDCSVSFTATLNTYQITASGDSWETFSPADPQTVSDGATQAYTVAANAGYTLSTSVGGTCPVGSWSGDVYTTGAIVGDCSVSFSATLNTYQVTASGDSWETFSPATPQTVGYGAAQAFTVTASAGHTLSTAVGGTCPVGSWSGNVYTTGAIVGDCMVSFSATLSTYQVTASGDSWETFTPATPQLVSYGSTQAYTVTASAGYTLSTVGGSCQAGLWSGNVYTTGAIIGSCAVSFSATPNTYQVTASGDSWETFSPATPQTVSYGSTQAYTVTANAGYTLSTAVGGTCATGSWSGDVYTTGAIAGDCTVSFSATIESYQVAASGDSRETIAPATPQTVSDGSTQAYTVTANADDTLSTAVGGTCPAGSWSGSVYTTGAIVGDCTVSFSATLETYRVTASGDSRETIAPSAAQTVSDGSTQAYTVTAHAGDTLSTAVGGTCPAGSWSGDVYTTGAIVGDCTVSFSASLNEYQVTASGDSWEAFSPAEPQTVSYGSTQAYTVTASPGYTLSTTVGGTCVTGSWSGDVYTTGAIVGICTVAFSATLETHQVTASGDSWETIAPNASQAVSYGSTQAYTVAASAGSTLSTDVGGTCPAGSWSGEVYTTGAIVSDCTVAFSATYTAADGLALLAGSLGGPGFADGTGSAARFNLPMGVAVDGSGNVYVADTSNDTIRMITPAGVVTTLAGAVQQAGFVDGTGSAARFNNPEGIAVDSAGNLYVADTVAETIRKVTPAGVVTTVAGGAGILGFVDGTGSVARFFEPHAVAVDSAGNLYVSDSFNNAIRKVTPAGVVTTLAGNGQAGSTDGTGSAALFNQPKGIAVDGSGNVYVADNGNSTIRRVTPAGVVTTLAGAAGQLGTADGTGAAARFAYPTGVAVDGSGNVYVADSDNSTIRKITAAGVVTTLAGNAALDGSADGTGAAATFKLPDGVAVDGSGNVYVADCFNSLIRKVTPAGVVTTLAGSAPQSGSADGAGSAARFNLPQAIAVDSGGNVYVADTQNYTIRQVTPTGVVTTLAGAAEQLGSADGTGSAARFALPRGIGVDSAGNVYVADTYNSTIRLVTPAGVVTTLAGTAGQTGSADGTGSAARFNFPEGLAVDSAGNVYVADTINDTIRKVTPAGVVTTLAGAAMQPNSMDGTGSAARFSSPEGVAVDSAGNVYVADTDNNMIRLVTPAGVVTTLAGRGLPGDADGTGSAADFNSPQGVAVDSVGNVYVADTANDVIREVTTAGVVTTVVGVDATTATVQGPLPAWLRAPTGVAVAPSGDLIVAEANAVLVVDW